MLKCNHDKRVLILDGVIIDLSEGMLREKGRAAVARKHGCESMAEAAELQAKALEFVAFNIARLRNAILQECDHEESDLVER